MRASLSYVVGSELVLYSEHELGPDADLSAPLRAEQGSPRLTLNARSTFRPLERLREPRLHTVVRCDLASDRPVCRGSAMIGAPGRGHYVARRAVYVVTAAADETAQTVPEARLLRFSDRAPAVLALPRGPLALDERDEALRMVLDDGRFATVPVGRFAERSGRVSAAMLSPVPTGPAPHLRQIVLGPRHAVYATSEEVRLFAFDGNATSITLAPPALDPGATPSAVDFLAPMPGGVLVVSADFLAYLEPPSARVLYGRIHDVSLQSGAPLASHGTGDRTWVAMRARAGHHRGVVLLSLGEETLELGTFIESALEIDDERCGPTCRLGVVTPFVHWTSSRMYVLLGGDMIILERRGERWERVADVEPPRR